MDAPSGARSSRVPRPRARLGGRRGTPYLAAHAYLLGSFTEFHRLGSFQRLTLCWRIFGRDRVTGEIARLRAVLARWGYQLGRDDDSLLPLVASQLFLFNRSPHLEDLSTDLLNRFRTERLIEGARLNTLYALQRAVAELGFCDPPHHRIGAHSPRATGGAAIWEQWADCWHATLDRMTVGDYVQRTAGLGDRIGKPLEAPSKERQLAALRRFFSDCQEWEWLPRRFDPRRALATPRSIAALLGPNPRMIADDIWAKLLWAGLNLQTGDLPVTTCGAAERRVPAGG